MTMSTHDDANIILKLYELRTEPVLRKARHWVALEYWPASFEELQKEVSGTPGNEHNDWWRQVLSYWEMAASFVLSGALNEDLFADNAGELCFLYAKYNQYLPKFRETQPTFLMKMEEVVKRSKVNMDRVALQTQFIAKAMAAKAAAKAAQQ